MTRVVVLRPQPGASETVGRARERGLDAVAVPLFEIEAIDWHAPDPARFDAILLTSANAVRCAGEQLQTLRGLRAYAVGAATAEVARDAGFDIAATGDDGVDRLLASIEPMNLLHLCGEDRHRPTGARHAIAPVVVYRSTSIAHPDLATVRRAVALVHSPRAGRRLAELVHDRRSTAIAAISEAAAAAVGGGWRAVEAAERPTDDVLLALAARLCNIPPLQ